MSDPSESPPDERTWLDGPINFLMWLACFIGLVMMLHVTADVTGRVLFRHPFDGTTEIVSGYYMIGITFLPFAYVARYDGHIIVELFTRNMPPRRLLRFDALVNILTFAYMCVFTWMSTVSAVDETATGEVWQTANGYIQGWPSRWILPVSGLLMTAYIGIRIVRDLRRAADMPPDAARGQA